MDGLGSLFIYCGDMFAESILISLMEFVTVMKLNASLFQTPFFPFNTPA